MNIDPKILSTAANRFGIELSAIRPLGGMEGLACEYKQGGCHFVLKVTPGAKDDPDQITRIEEKFEFINYLAENGVRVAQPVPSPSGAWVERIETEEKFYLVTSATKAAGRHFSFYQRSEATPNFFQAWGRITGQMHALAKTYPYWQKDLGDANKPSTIGDWRSEHQFFRNWCQFEQIREKWDQLGTQIEALPRNREGFGLIHNDLHPWNFLVHNGEITVIDFDVCSYHFFAKDIAIALFFANWHGKPLRGQTKDDYLTDFFRNFMIGYAPENDLEDIWFENLPLFLKHHQILLHTVFTDEWKTPSKWEADVLARWRRQILNDVPVVTIVF
jgi:Ser/Thr protein kinase RdoA (MazF antagonist)